MLMDLAMLVTLMRIRKRHIYNYRLEIQFLVAVTVLVQDIFFDTFEVRKSKRIW